VEEWKKEFSELLFSKHGSYSRAESAYRLKLRNMPKSVFKYMRFDKYEHSINHFKNGTIWLSNPSDFNDPFDSVINIDFLKIFHESTLSGLFEIAENKHKLSFEKLEEARRTGNPRETLTRFIMEKAGLSGEKLEEFIRFNESLRVSRASEARWNLVYELRSNMRVCSFSARNDKMLMWAHYADNHKGFCIEYDLSTAFENDLNLRFLYPVIYSNDLTDFTDKFGDLEKTGEMPSYWAKKAAMHKAEDWSYEEEWRLIFSEGKVVEGLRKFLPIKALYLGSKINEKNSEKIIGLASLKSIDVYRTYLCQDKFGLEFEKVND
jgi:hypothetical protein